MTTTSRTGVVESASADSVAGGHYPAENLPVAAPPQNHGRTVAAWALFWFGVIASTVSGIGFVLPSMPVILAGVAVFVVGAVVSVALRAAGHGQAPKARARG
ncbi:HGxxPAAW family protein [Ruania alba]|uniref:Uncharacterized protein n=1 Tax=Ruania alba TaxID=648782 RepID=A0A1H5GKG8_9MICO|nr:HGxxPAAW family protein [Ruania alba]SEE16253.1 hypothetical protein SAMN04488554_1683 [Ruania alba]